MEEIIGTIRCDTFDKESKSEGTRAVLVGKDGREYKLYRKETYPVDDAILISFDGKEVQITGENEEDTGNFCVVSIKEANKTDNI